MPLWLLLTVLMLGSYRLTRLAVADDFPPVLWVRTKLAGNWTPVPESKHGAVRAIDKDHRFIDGVLHHYTPRVRWSPYWLAELATCPWCASAYISGGLVGGTAVWTSVPLPVLVWLAVWGSSALLASQEWS